MATGRHLTRRGPNEDIIMLKRLIDVTASAIVLLVTLPFLVAAALAVRFSSPGPILFRQPRVGRNGRVFEILKFRTMRVAQDTTNAITVGRDPRITPVGHFLRQSKIDELPQLVNVLRGDMSLVGPRPEVPHYVALYPDDLRRRILSVRPGITDRASIKYRNEAELLVRQPDPDAYYRSVIMHDKLQIAAHYAVEQQLIPSPVFATMRAAGHLPIPAPDTASAWLDERRTRLARRLAEVERKAETDALEDVQLSLGKLRISPLKAVTQDEADSALAPLYAHLPAIRITDLLAEVDRWTGFSQCFTHLQSGRVADEPRAILTAVLADATNLGHKRMAEACDLVTQRQLSWLASWHLREETYGRALARLVNAQHTAPLAALFGSGTSSSSDGQNFLLDRRAQATGAVNPHKGAEPAVSFYSHVSDRYAPFHSTVISASASEAAQVLDGLLHHGADLHIEEHHVDGGGVSDHVFAPCHLLGFRFAPRIPNIAARRLHLFNGIEPGPDIAPLVAGRIDEALIAAHWDDVLRLGTSIRTGVVSASIMLERLGSYPRANGLALALREIGRVERTLFTLDWIEQPEQRRRATRELNKGEAENALKRAIFFHRIGRIRDHALQAQTHRASALNLVAGAIVLWNTTYLQAARMHLASLGRSIPPDLLQHLSPLGWQHINLTGDYLWTDPDAPSSALRPLRQVHAVEGPAKP